MRWREQQRKNTTSEHSLSARICSRGGILKVESWSIRYAWRDQLADLLTSNEYVTTMDDDTLDTRHSRRSFHYSSDSDSVTRADHIPLGGTKNDTSLLTTYFFLYLHILWRRAVPPLLGTSNIVNVRCWRNSITRKNGSVSDCPAKYTTSQIYHHEWSNKKVLLQIFSDTNRRLPTATSETCKKAYHRNET